MKLFRRLRDRIVDSRIHSANFQEEIDTNNVWSLLKFKEDYTRGDIKGDTPYEPPTTSYSNQKLFIMKTFDREIEKLFKYVHNQGGLDPYPAPVIEKQQGEEELSYEEIAERRLDVISESEARNLEAEIIERPLPHPDGFVTQICYSSIDHPAAGFGVKIKEGSVLPGTVLGLYPGTIYTPDAFEHLNKDSQYMLTGYDGIVVDAHGWAEEAIELRRKFRQYKNISTNPPQLLRYRNPFAICNYINHPPKGKKPNVFGYTYCFDKKKFPQELLPYIPHKFKQKPKWYFGETANYRTVVFVSTSHIEPGDELFLDYRFNPKFDYPDWYHPVDEETAARRWAPTRILYF